MHLKITEVAKKKFQEQLKKRGHGVGIKIATRPSGCSGLSYIIEYLDAYPKAGTENYAVFYTDVNDAKIFVYEKDYVYLDGMEVDYVKKGLNEGFEFHNPNSKGDCGCGESFRV